MKLKWSSDVAPSEELIDAVLDIYVTWREQSAAVTATYRVWRDAPAHTRARAYHDYAAALDREELAANEYRRLVGQAGAGC